MRLSFGPDFASFFFKNPRGCGGDLSGSKACKVAGACAGMKHHGAKNRFNRIVALREEGADHAGKHVAAAGSCKGGGADRREPRARTSHGNERARALQHRDGAGLKRDVANSVDAVGLNDLRFNMKNAGALNLVRRDDCGDRAVEERREEALVGRDQVECISITSGQLAASAARSLSFARSLVPSPGPITAAVNFSKSSGSAENMSSG